MINQENVDMYYDYVDQACLIIYEQLKINYLDCLLRVGNDILMGIDENDLSPEAILELEKIYEKIIAHSFFNEEVRLAMQLLIAKAFKHGEEYPLDLMTPDSVSYLFAFIVNEYFSNENPISILDVGVGTSNLINAISNFINKDFNNPILIGIEKEQTLAQLAKLNTDLQGNEMQIYLNDALNPNYLRADVIVGDIDPIEVDDKYLPYEVINNYLDKLNDDGIFIFLISNDFFNKKGIDKFREKFYGTLLGLIVLPESFFKEDAIGKSILIGTSKEISNYEMLVMNLLTISNKEAFQNNIKNISEWINNLKGR